MLLFYRHLLKILVALLLVASSSVFAGSFTAFESGQVRPLAISPDNTKLFVVNTPDNRLEIFDISSGSPVYISSVGVGLEPVAVAAYSNSEVWVVNYLSDSISIVDVTTAVPRVSRTLLVGDEPADIVFAGPAFNRAFITTAHRGQNSPYDDPLNPGELITEGIGRADVWVFDVNNLGAALQGTPITIVELFGDTPKALTVSPDGSKVYAAIFKSGNQTTTLHEQIICDQGQPSSCDPLSAGELPPPAGLTIDGLPQPEVGLIVKYDGSKWLDELGRDWSPMVRFDLPDKDVFAIDANAAIPVETDFFSKVGTVLFNMAVNPVSGKIYVSNTEAINEVRFEGPGTTSTTVQGHLHEARITVIDPNSTTPVTPIHLNKHINYNVTPAPAGIKQNSLAIPKGLAVTADGNTLYVVAKGSSKVGVFDTAALENNTFTPDSSSHIVLTGGGPGGLVLDEVHDRLYVTTRFDNALSVIDTSTNTEIIHLGLHNPETPEVIAGRQFLYDANYTSSNGEASCASCHIEGDKDELAWDLGDPDGSVVDNLNPFFLIGGETDFHPMKGPMTTQTLRGMDNHGPMHWRGDRSGINNGGDALNEDQAFREFNPAFDGLIGRGSQLTTSEMQAFSNFILQVTPPPNPVRALDDTLNADQAAGEDFYMNEVSDTITTCNGCHALNPGAGFFGANGLSSFDAETQHFKIPQLRNMYEKVGMFGMPDVPFFISGDNAHKGDQIRGFGFTHDGSTDSLDRFFNAAAFDFGSGPSSDTKRKQMVQFVLAFDSNLKPVVGQQVTLNKSNKNDVAVNDRVDLLISRAQAGDADLIVKYTINDETRGAYRLGNGNFSTDKVSESEQTESQIRAFAELAGHQLTFTAVPLGSAVRMGVDRDEDAILDYDDNCSAFYNPSQIDSNSNGIGDACEPDTDNDGVTDSLDNCPFVTNALQENNDNDAMGDVCDSDDDNDGLLDAVELVIGTDPFLADTDGDTLSDFDEVNHDGNASTYNPVTDTNPLATDTDADGYDDNIELNYNSNPLLSASIPADGDLNQDGVVNASDLLIMIKLSLGLQSVTSDQLIKGDVAPLSGGTPNPDGIINTADLLVLQRKILGNINF